MKNKRSTRTVRVNIAAMPSKHSTTFEVVLRPSDCIRRSFTAVEVDSTCIRSFAIVELHFCRWSCKTLSSLLDGACSQREKFFQRLTLEAQFAILLDAFQMLFQRIAGRESDQQPEGFEAWSGDHGQSIDMFPIPSTLRL